MFAYVIKCNQLFVVTQQKRNAVNERLKYHEENIKISNLGLHSAKALSNTNALMLKTGTCHKKQQ